MTKPKFLNLAFASMLYAVAAVFFLLEISPAGGLYGSWDTARYLVMYWVLSFIYLIWIGKYLKVRIAPLIPLWIIIVIIFSLLFSLIRLSATLWAQAWSLKTQRIYFLTFFLFFSYAVFYYMIKAGHKIAPCLKNQHIELPVTIYLTLHYTALIPYFVYMLIKDGKTIHIIIALIVMTLLGLCAWIFKWQSTGRNFHKLSSFFLDARGFIFLIFIFALAIRVLFAIQLTHNLPAGFMEGPDTSEIDKEARYISETWNIFDGNQGFLDMKGSAILFYALIYKIFGYNPFCARLFDALLGAVGVIFIYLITSSLFNSTAARIAAFLSAGYGYLIQYGVYIGAEALGLFTIELFVLGILIAKQKENRTLTPWAFISGISLALCVMARAEYYYALIIIFLWIFYIFRQKRINILFFFLGFLVVSIPWACRNFITFGEFTLSSAVSEAFKENWMRQLWQYEILKFAQAGLPVRNMADIFIYFFSHPIIALGIILPHALKGAYNFWDYNAFFSPAFVFIEPKNSCYNLILCFYLYGFMLAGFFISNKKRDIALLLLFIIIFKTVSYIFTTTPTFFENGGWTPLFKDWYRFTMIPFTQIFMGGGLAYLLGRAKEYLDYARADRRF